MEKTNVMRVLDQKKVHYTPYSYEADGSTTGVQVAERLGLDAERVFKTLVTVGASKKNYVFVVPVREELDLKKAAKCVGEKKIEMLPMKELLPLTGYVHGGCSPIGMKKFFTTTVHESAAKYETIFFSAGKIGFQVEVAPKDLEKVIRLKMADIILE